MLRLNVAGEAWRLSGYGRRVYRDVWFFYLPCGRPRESECGEDTRWRLFLEAVVYRRRDDRPLAALGRPIDELHCFVAYVILVSFSKGKT